MPLHEVIRREMQPNRRFKVFPFLAECECEPIQALHIKARAGVQPFHMTRRNSGLIRIAHHDVFLDRDNFRGAIPPFRRNGFDGCIGFNN